MKKGQIVSVTATVITGYLYDEWTIFTGRSEHWKLIHEPKNNSNDKSNSRCLLRMEYQNPIQIVLIGKTTIQTGIRVPEIKSSYEDYDPPRFISDKHHKVWAAVTYSETDNRYTSPIYVLEDDVIL